MSAVVQVVNRRLCRIRRLHTYVCTYAVPYVCTQYHMYAQHVNEQISKCTCSPYIYICIKCIYLHWYVHIYIFIYNIYIYMNIYIRIIFTSICIYIYIYIYIHFCFSLIHLLYVIYRILFDTDCMARLLHIQALIELLVRNIWISQAVLHSPISIPTKGPIDRAI